MGPSPDRNVLRNTDASSSVAGEIWFRADVACPCLRSAGEKLAVRAASSCGGYRCRFVHNTCKRGTAERAGTERLNRAASGSRRGMGVIPCNGGPDLDPKAPAAWLVAKPPPAGRTMELNNHHHGMAALLSVEGLPVQTDHPHHGGFVLRPRRGRSHDDVRPWKSQGKPGRTRKGTESCLQAPSLGSTTASCWQ